MCAAVVKTLRNLHCRLPPGLVYANRVYCTDHVGEQRSQVQMTTVIKGHGNGSVMCGKTFKTALVPVEWNHQTLRVYKSNQMTFNPTQVQSSAAETGLVRCGKDFTAGQNESVWSGSSAFNKELNAFVDRKIGSVGERQPYSSNKFSKIQHVVLTGVQSIKPSRKDFVAKLAKVSSAMSGRLYTVPKADEYRPKAAMFSTIAKSERHIALPSLKYNYGDLEPNISSEIMEIHHSRHHKNYVLNFNKTVDQLHTVSAKDRIATIEKLLPELQFNYGGHINHTIFWDTLSPHTTKPSDDLMTTLDNNFGSCDEFKKQLATVSISVKGSGWGWLAINPQTKKLSVINSANQNLLFPATGLIPLMGIDVWEHAYHIQYKNDRGKYIEKVLEIINWENVSKRFAEASG